MPAFTIIHWPQKGDIGLFKKFISIAIGEIDDLVIFWLVLHPVQLAFGFTFFRIPVKLCAGYEFTIGVVA